MSVGDSSLLINQDFTNERHAELFRLSIARLAELKLPATPIFYTLIYTSLAGSSKELQEEIDHLLDIKQFDFKNAYSLYAKYFLQCHTPAIEEIRTQLMLTMSDVIASISALAGKAKVSTESLQTNLNYLSQCNTSADFAAAVSGIIQSTSSIISENQKLQTGLQSSAVNLEHMKEELDIAKSAASIDALTGVYNRLGLDQELTRLINDRRFKDKSFCVLMGDIDHFKQINDQHGHLIGDKVLKAFANLLKQRTRESDFVARFGGEEFVILLPHTTLNNAFLVAENIRKAVEKMRIKDNKNTDPESAHKITISFGIAIHRLGESAESVIERCDQAMYRAKNAGRNRSMIASSG